MTNQDDRSPALRKESFTCPYCGVYAQQKWATRINGITHHELVGYTGAIETAHCNSCLWSSIWRDKEMIYPLDSSAPKPVINMPDDVKEIYEEARQVHVYSARAAAALLRVALEKLTIHLGETTGKLNTRIGNLQKQGLPPQVISSFDIVRIVGNEGGAHVGTIDLTGADGADVVNKLFWLINYIIEKTINEPAEIERIAQTLPQDKLDGIENRDKK